MIFKKFKGKKQAGKLFFPGLSYSSTFFTTRLFVRSFRSGSFIGTFYFCHNNPPLILIIIFIRLIYEIN